MVHKKYIKRGGKLFGPYYYKNYREGDKVKSIYIGKTLKKPEPSPPYYDKKDNSFSYPTKFIAIILIILVLAIGTFTLFARNSDDFQFVFSTVGKVITELPLQQDSETELGILSSELFENLATTHTPTSVSVENKEISVEITCNSQPQFMRHCWTTDLSCEPGLFDANTCSLQGQSCQVTQADIGEWTLCSRCKDASGWSAVTCTNPYIISPLTPPTLPEVPISEEGVTYSKFSITKCSNGVCNMKSYMTQIAIQNEQGIWRPFKEVVKVDSSNNLLTIEWKNKKVTFAPYIVYKDTKHRAKVPGQISTLAEIPTEIPLQHQHTEKAHSYKYDMIVQQLSEQASQDISKIGLEIAEIEGFSESEIKYRGNNIILPEGIKFSWDDAAKQGFDVARSQKGMEITNVKGMQEIMIDPEISADALEDLHVLRSYLMEGIQEWKGYFKFPLDNITAGATVNSADMVFNVEDVMGEPPLTTTFYNCTSAWDEGSAAAVLLALPCTSETTAEITDPEVYSVSVTDPVADAFAADDVNITFRLETADTGGAPDLDVAQNDPTTVIVGLEDPEGGPNFYQITDREGDPKPYLNITYTEASDTDVPVIEFISTTPANSTNTTTTTVYVNTTVVDASSDIGTCLLTWKQGAAAATNKTMTKTANGGDDKNVTCNYTHTSLADAIYTYKVLANDTEVNFNLTNTRQVIVDAFPPEAVFISATPANATNQTSLTVHINATVSDRNLISPISTCTLTWKKDRNTATNYTMTKTNNADGKNVTCNYTFTKLLDATYTYKILMNDTLNNWNTTNTRQVGIDTMAPHVAFTSPTNTTYTTNNITVDISSTGFYTWWRNATTEDNITYTSSFTLNLSNAQYTFTAFTNDTVNNVNSTNATFFIHADSDVPIIEFISATPGNASYQTSTTIHINATVWDVTSNIANCSLGWDLAGGATYYTMTKTANGGDDKNVTCNYTHTGLSDGVYSYDITANDTSENQNQTKSRLVTIDATNPLINFTQPTYNNGSEASGNSIPVNVTITETNFANFTFILASSSAVVNTTYVTTKTKTMLNFTSLSADTYKYNVTITDLAGNKNLTETRTITVPSSDSDVPVIVYIATTPANSTNQTTTTVYINTTIVDATSAIANCTLTWKQGTSTATNKTMTKTNNADAKNVTCNYTHTSLSDAIYTYKVLANDTQSNFNLTNVRQVIVDAFPPEATFISTTPANATNQTSTTVYINATVSDRDLISPISTCTLTWKQGAAAATNKTMTKTANSGSDKNVTCNYTHTSLTDATYTYKLLMNDTLNNWNTTNTKQVGIDTMAPHVAFTSPTNTTYTTNNITVDISSTGFYTWWRNATDADNITYTSSFTLNLSNAQYTFTAFTNDTVNNVNSTNVTFYIFSDTNKPTIEYIATTPANSTNQTSTTVYINTTVVDASNNIGTCLLTWKQGASAATNKTMTKTNNADGKNVTCNYTHTSLSDAIYTYKVLANDTQSNFNLTNVRQVIVDAFPPEAVFISATPANATNQTSTTVHINATVSDRDLISPISTCLLTWKQGAAAATNKTMTKTANSGSDKNVTCNYTHTSLTDATYTYKILMNDTLNNWNTTNTRQVGIDTMAPHVAFTSPTNTTYTTNNITLDISSTGFYTWWRNATTEDNITYTSSFTLNLSNAQYTFTAFTNDTVNNVNSTNLTFFINADTNKPIIEYITATPANSTNQTSTTVHINTTVVDASSNIGTCLLTWKQGTNAATNKTMTKTNNADGKNVTCNYTHTSLSDAIYTYKVLANDTQANFNLTNVRQVIVDAFPPEATFISATPANATNQTSTTVHINATVSDRDLISLISTCTLTWKQGAAAATNKTMTKTNNADGKNVTCNYTHTSLSDETYTYKLLMNDTLNNWNTTNTRQVGIDTMAPHVAFTSPTNTTYTTNNITLDISSTGFYTWWRNATTEDNITYTSSFTLNLSNAQYTFTAFTNDTVNNVNSTNLTFFINADTNKPIIEYITATPANSTNQTSTTVYINTTVVDASNNIGTCLLTWKQGASAATNKTMTKTNNADGKNVTCNYTHTSLSDAIYTYKVLANDTQSNFNLTNMRQVTIDATEPLVFFTTNTPANNTNTSSTSILINATIMDEHPANLTFILTNNTAEVNRTFVTTNSNSNYTINFTTLSDGTYQYNVTASDYLGNKNFTGTRTLTIDTLEPFIDYTGLTLANGTFVSQNYILINVTSSDITTGVVNLTFTLANITNGLTTELNRTFISTGLPNVTLNFTSLSDGTYLYNITASDYVGNMNTTSRRTITLDITAPSVDYGNRTFGSSYATDYILINATASDTNLGNVTFNLTNATIVINTTFITATSASLTKFLNFTNLSQGNYSFNLIAADKAGNKGFSSTRNATLNGTTTEEEEEETPGGGGAGGGPGGGAATLGFDVDKESIKFKLKVGEERKETIKVRNIGSKALDISAKALGEASDYLFIEDKVFSLKPKGAFYLDIANLPIAIEGIYAGKLLIESMGIQKEIPVVIEVSSKEPLFDVRIELPREQREVIPNSNLIPTIILTNLGDIMKVDVFLTYAIKDSLGNVVFEDKETMAVEDKVTIERTFPLLREISEGSYSLGVVLEYKESIAVSSVFFQVIKKPLWLGLDYLTLALLAFLLIAIIIATIYLERKLKAVKKKLKTRNPRIK